MSERSQASVDDLGLTGDDWEGVLEGFEDDPETATRPVDDAPPAPAGSASDPEGGSPAAPADPDARPASTDPAAPAAATVPAEATPAPFQPPQGGQPFALKVDGQEIPIEGASVHGDYLVIPKATWDRTIRPQYLGDRTVWRQKEQGYQRQLQQVAAQQSEETLRARGLLAKVAELDKGGPEAWATWLDNFHQNRPILEAEIKARIAEQRAAALEQQQRAVVEEQAKAAEEPLYQQHLIDTLRQALAQDEYKVLASEQDELLRELWEDHRDRLFVVADRDYPEYGVRQGEPAFNYDALNALLTRQAAKAAKVRQQVEQLERAAKVNASVQPAVAPKPAAKRPVQPPRNDKGQFQRPSWQQFKDQVLEEDWSNVFTE